jgi:hypothetical protein
MPSICEIKYALSFHPSQKLPVGLGTGKGITSTMDGVTNTVDFEGSTDCLPPIGANATTVFSLSTYNPAPCEPITITSGQASSIRAFVLKESSFEIDLPDGSPGA